MTSNTRLAHLDTLKDQLRPLCFDYVSRHRNVSHGRKFSCINPAHPDKDPSMGFVPNAPELCHCFGCGITADIFTAAHMIEGLPLSGPGFLHENMFYLAESFGLEVPSITISPEEQRELDILRAHTCASNIITGAAVSPMVAAKLADYGWSDQTQNDLGIGSVTSYDLYMDLMINTYGFSAELLNSVDLDNPKIFHPDHLIFTVRDEYGQPVGFASRNLHFDDAKARYKQAVEQFGSDSREASDAKRAMPAKFVNSAASITMKSGEVVQKNHIYRKGERLFGLHIARKFAPPLFIFEGYGDGGTAQDKGLHNAVGIGALAFTKEHLETLLRMKIDHLIFVFDGDKAGGKGTKSAIEKVEAIIKQNVGLKVQVILIPEEDDDPDLYLRRHGLESFLNLERIDIFTWKMMNAVAEGGDPDKVFEDSVGLILNEVNHRMQFRMAQSLAIATGIPEAVVWSEVERRRDVIGQQVRAEMVTVAQNTVKELQKRPEAIVEILREGHSRVERLAGRRSENDTQALIRYFDSITDKAETNMNLGGLQTGYPIFDMRFGGIPKEDAFITFPGKANHGKTTFGCNILGRIVDRYPDVVALIHTIDDPLSKFWNRLCGSRFGVPSWWFEYAGYHLHRGSRCKVAGEMVDFGDIYYAAKKWLRDHMVDERMQPFDVSLMDSSLDVLETKVMEMRKRYSNSPIIIFTDNFHKYQVPGDGKESDIRGMSNRLKELTTKQHVTVMSTMEIPKGVMAPGIRPRGDNMKGSGGILYDASANIGVYNDKKDMRDKAVLTWDEILDEPEEIAPGLTTMRREQPVLEMIFDKSKLFKGFDGEIYYRMHAESGTLEECDVQDQDRYRRKALAAQEEREDRKKGKGNSNGGGNYGSSNRFQARQYEAPPALDNPFN
jgi:DNA primase